MTFAHFSPMQYSMSEKYSFFLECFFGFFINHFSNKSRNKKTQKSRIINKFKNAVFPTALLKSPYFETKRTKSHVPQFLHSQQYLQQKTTNKKAQSTKAPKINKKKNCVTYLRLESILFPIKYPTKP